MVLGPLMLDIEGFSLTPEDRELLAHPAVGGIILFSRNYSSPSQLCSLCRQIHSLRDPRLIIAVDQEGGRVQRFRGEFSQLPPASEYGQLYDANPQEALKLVRNAGWLVASELGACGVDVNFAPVLDLCWGHSNIIGDRAFHREADVVTQLGQAFKQGMAQAGMQSIGKHFPGHGWVREDSHKELPLDNRSLVDLEMDDLLPFERMINNGLAGIMTGHIVFPEIDNNPVSFSRKWLREILRGRMRFQGAVFSDDLSMHGAHVAGSAVERAESALAAGCDMILYCNDRPGAVRIITALGECADAVRGARLIRLHGQEGRDWQQLHDGQRYKELRVRLEALNVAPGLDLYDDNRV